MPLRIWLRRVMKTPHNSQLAEHSLTKNISTKGCYFRLAHELPVGSEIEMEIQMPVLDPDGGGIKLGCHATVVRVENGSSGNIGIACQIQHYWYSQPGAHPRRVRVA